MTRFTRSSVFLALVLLGFPLGRLHGSRAGDPLAAGKEVVLKAADITPKIFPERVFFRGQSAPVQFRNSGGVHLADDFYVLVGLVDSSGYSSGIKEKYQAYLLNEVTLEIAGQTLAPPSAARASRICRCGSVRFACRRGRNVGLAWRGRAVARMQTRGSRMPKPADARFLCS